MDRYEQSDQRARRREARAHRRQAAAADVRVEDVPDPDGRRRNPVHLPLLAGGRHQFQRPGDGSAGPVAGGPVQLLQAVIFAQDDTHARGPDDHAPGVPAPQDLHAPRPEARQLLHREVAQEDHGVPDRLRPREALHGQQQPHPVQGAQVADRHGPLLLHQHAPGHRAVPPRRPRVAGLHLHLLREGLAAVAGPQGQQQEAEVRAHPREEARHPRRAAVPRHPVRVRRVPALLQVAALRRPPGLRLPQEAVPRAVRAGGLRVRLRVRLEPRQPGHGHLLRAEQEAGGRGRRRRGADEGRRRRQGEHEGGQEHQDEQQAQPEGRHGPRQPRRGQAQRLRILIV